MNFNIWSWLLGFGTGYAMHILVLMAIWPEYVKRFSNKDKP